MTARRMWVAADTLFLLLFALSVVVQWNDPDPFVWMAIYGAAAVACALSLARKLPRWLPMLIALIAILWSLTFVPRVLGKVPFLDMFQTWEMNDIGIEESREMYGLLIVAAWMLVLAWRQRRLTQRA
ncbi:MAG TPA: transmembrane 220 family protein [Gemmatimonadaceae bacterium]|nr:transmembrane 220 family protein [Gemmatimonadaceae bacterium]